MRPTKKNQDSYGRKKKKRKNESCCRKERIKVKKRGGGNKKDQMETERMGNMDLRAGGGGTFPQDGKEMARRKRGPAKKGKLGWAEGGGRKWGEKEEKEFK